MKAVLKRLRQELESNADEKIRESGRHFFKEEIRPYGIKTAVVTKIARDYFRTVRDNGKAEIFGLCEDLWRSGWMEESFIACNWSYYMRKEYTPDDFALFEKWIDRYVTNWASCDTLCNHTVGAFIDMYPEYINGLKKWARSKNRWMKRAAAVSLIIPAKGGRYLEDVFEIADILFLDTDDLVQKGYGWMLKAATEMHRGRVFDYVMQNKSVMPRTALRYAIEKMPADMKKMAMEK